MNMNLLERAANALKQQSINVPAGTLEGESGEYNIRFDTEALSKNALLNLPIITLSNGAVVYLRKKSSRKAGVCHVAQPAHTTKANGTNHSIRLPLSSFINHQ